MTIYHQTAVKGLNLAKATEDQLCDLSRSELVDAVIAYRKDYEYKQQECKKLRDVLLLSYSNETKQKTESTNLLIK